MIPATMTRLGSPHWEKLYTAFGERIQRDVPLARYTAARVGGTADFLVVAESVDHLVDAVSLLWSLEIPFIVLGGGSNVLVSDEGVREVVILNRAREITIDAGNCMVWAASGASFGQMARKVSSMGFQGLEWATGIPGTVGGAVYGNAGAHGSDVAKTLIVAEILHQDESRKQYTAARMGYGYRSSILKRESIGAVILSASFRFEEGTRNAAKELVDQYAAWRKQNQPPGASMGSMFKNPPGDFAGRLIELAGLKGVRIGGTTISPVHANFFVNNGEAKAGDILALVRFAQKTVLEKFGVELPLEIELIGEWKANDG